MLEILIGQIPEAIYFSLFMIFAKNLKSKRILFIILMIAEYLLCLNSMPYDMVSHVLVFIMSYLTLKILYKEKAQITDVFTLGIASIILIICCIIPSFIVISNPDLYLLYVLITRILVFLFLILFKNKLYKIQNIYKKFWNRNDKIKKKMKSTTFRSLNLVVFNVVFYIIHLGMLYALYFNFINK